MNERRPPRPPITPSALPKPKRGESSIDSTVLAPRPAFTDEGSMEDGAVFDADDVTGDPAIVHEEGTHTMKKPSRTTISSTADVSVIEARELRPGASDGNFGFEIARTNASDLDDGIMFDEGYSPATEVLRLAFSDDGESVTPAPAPVPVPAPAPVEQPVEVRKWRAGGGARPPVPPEAAPPPPAQPSPPPPSMAVGTRIDLVAPPRPGTAPLDVDELRRTLEEAEKLLRTVKHQASSLDLDLVAPGARGMNAQLAAALHRLGEALAMLGK